MQPSSPCLLIEGMLYLLLAVPVIPKQGHKELCHKVPALYTNGEVGCLMAGWRCDPQFY
jgi:hypothetical protein